MYRGSKGTHRCIPRSAGYSVLEAMVVLAISGTVMATAVPTMVRLIASTALPAAVQQVGMDLQLARMQAIAQATRFQVVFETTGNTYEIQREVAPDTFVNEGGMRTLPHPVQLMSAYPDAIVFDTRGRLSMPAQVQLSDGSGHYGGVALNVLGCISRL